MLFFKKSAPILSDLLPVDYVDIHSHLLPGIDDGAKDSEDTKNLINDLKQIGFSKFITTPHIITGIWDNTFNSITSKLEETKLLLNEIELKAAAEYMIDSFFFERIKQGEKLLSLKENYVLIEMSYLNAPIQLYDIIFEIQVQGYKPVLAHPERYLFYGNNFDEFYKLKKSGCLFQLNLLSTTGYYGTGVTKIAQRLLNENLYDFVGSDVHHQKHVKSLKTKVLLKNHHNLSSLMKNNSFFSH
ncbi:tyrosine-protein phosphatase [Flavobacterium sp.]|uniref:tyrosine-protein phosphatase n=1 Tax=Flavobacterium sp. TaxID=239 RepID=UPI002B4B209B|nr:CpsB/CapC family capsule biosynthesis tyrosine phosphatase [Flavobacterium sp.]HLP65554.1 CpsB/CapC family capsule biosynthesis tyrosine phosphatase [Flavobacterium sp.]